MQLHAVVRSARARTLHLDVVYIALGVPRDHVRLNFPAALEHEDVMEQGAHDHQLRISRQPPQNRLRHHYCSADILAAFLQKKVVKQAQPRIPLGFLDLRSPPLPRRATCPIPHPVRCPPPTLVALQPIYSLTIRNTNVRSSCAEQLRTWSFGHHESFAPESRRARRGHVDSNSICNQNSTTLQVLA